MTQPYPQPYPQDPPPAKAKTRTWLWLLIVVAAFILGIGVGGGISNVSEPASTEPSGTPAAPATAEKDEPEPDKAAGEVNGFCDYTLGEPYTFDASLEAVNTGNVDVKMDVWAEFDQLGHEPVRLVKKGVKVPVGESVDVHLSEEASTTQISRHQSADSKCDLGGDIVD